MALTDEVLTGEELHHARASTVVAHIEAERRQDFDGALATFARPRYELPGGEVVDGSDAVAQMYRDLHTGFPDLSFPEPRADSLVHHGDSVLVRSRMTGTHTGSLQGLPPTQRRIDVPLFLSFDFEGRDLVCEQVHYDRLTLLVQLGVARDPATTAGKLTTFLNHPVRLARAALRARR